MTGSLDHYRGLLGVVAILGLAIALSENRRAISKRMVVCGLAMQTLLGLLLLLQALLLLFVPLGALGLELPPLVGYVLRLAGVVLCSHVAGFEFLQSRLIG